jgi:hypothetical protein
MTRPPGKARAYYRSKLLSALSMYDNLARQAVKLAQQYVEAGGDEAWIRMIATADEDSKHHIIEDAQEYR